MALDVCIETYASVAPLVSNETIGGLLRLDQFRSTRTSPRRARPAGPDPAEALSAALDRLPFHLAQVLWLTAICGCTYDEAAIELSTTPDVVRDRVATAYRTIRAEIVERHPPQESWP